MKRMLTFLLSSALVVTVVPALAEADHPHGGPWGRLERDLKALALTPEQKTKVEAVLEATTKQRATLRDEFRQAHKGLDALLEQPAPDEQAVLRQAEKIGAVKTEQEKLLLRTLLKVRAELTPEQRKQLSQMPRDSGRRGAKRS